MFLKKFSISSGHSPDRFFLGIVFLLVLIGLFALASASSDIGKIEKNNPFYYLNNQIVRGFIPGIIGFIFCYFFYYRNWRKFAFWLFALNIILLILIFTPLGHSSMGASRWLNLGSLSFQPSEILKLTFILYLASIFSSSTIKNIKSGWKTYWIFISVSAVVAGLIIIQPATTMAVIVIGAGALMFFLYGASYKHFLLTLLMGVLGVVALSQMTSYRMERIAPFWNPIGEKISSKLVINTTKLKIDNYHLNQAQMAIGTGKIWGVGFGKSTTKFSVLPEPMGDSIFAVIAEEFGFVGSVLVIGLFALLVWRGASLVLRSHDDFARLSLIGFISVIAIQSIIHIAANTGLLPFTGVPLPFISYGGTSLAVTLTMIGIIANISKHATQR